MKILPLVFIFGSFFSAVLSAQSSDNESVITICYGSGPTKDAAINAALRNGIEKVIGSFISSKTQIEDGLIGSDEIVAISQGVILKYETILINGEGEQYEASLSAQISPKNVQTFLKSNGVEAEFSGGLMYQNIAIETFYEEQEAKAIKNFIESWNGIPLFDYAINDIGVPFKINAETYASRILLGGEAEVTKLEGSLENYLYVSYSWPIEVENRFRISDSFSVDGSGNSPSGLMPIARYLFYNKGNRDNDFYHVNDWVLKNWRRDYFNERWLHFTHNFSYGLEFAVECSPNQNFVSFFEGLTNLLQALSLSEETLDKRKSFGESYYPIDITEGTVNLRNQASIISLLQLSNRLLDQIYGYLLVSNKGIDFPQLRQYSGLGIRPKDTTSFSDLIFILQDAVSNEGGTIIDKDMYLLFRSTPPYRGGNLNTLDMSDYDYRLVNVYPPRGEGGHTANSQLNPFAQSGQSQNSDRYRLKNGKYLFQNHRVIVLFDNLEEIKNISGFKITANSW